jgi:hypothetical protein
MIINNLSITSAENTIFYTLLLFHYIKKIEWNCILSHLISFKELNHNFIIF